MKMQRKILLLLVLALCLLTACKKDMAALEVYDLGEDQVPALETILQSGEAILYSIDAPTDAAATEGLDLVHTYHYRQMADPALMAARYVDFLREDEQGMSLLDSENHRVREDPDMETLYGTVILGKTGTELDEGGKRFVRVIIGWSESALAVQVAYINGTILAPVEPPKENNSDDQESSGQSSPSASVSDQVEYFSSLDPRKLGLEGEDMSDYQIYGDQGWIAVDGNDCREIRVFVLDPKTATNKVVGTYYLSRDGTKVYQKGSDGQITLLQVE